MLIFKWNHYNKFQMEIICSYKCFVFLQHLKLSLSHIEVYYVADRHIFKAQAQKSKPVLLNQSCFLTGSGQDQPL